MCDKFGNKSRDVSVLEQCSIEEDTGKGLSSEERQVCVVGDRPPQDAEGGSTGGCALSERVQGGGGAAFGGGKCFVR